jgi:hypothetical protein
MTRVRLIHWNATEARPCIEKLRAAGYEVDFGGEYKEWKTLPCAAYIIDLTRLPSYGREVATALRNAKTTRAIPIVFVDGLPEKIEQIRRQLPDATYTTWPRIRSALKSALASPTADPVVPTQMMDRYGSRTVAQKLGIKENTSVLLIEPPRDYVRVLGDLPAGAWVEEEPDAHSPVTICFVREVGDLPGTLETARKLAAHSRLWICWPKGKKSGIREQFIRDSAIALGLVDYKVCSVDATWSGLLFSLKRT